jgi:hypothetical protein
MGDTENGLRQTPWTGQPFATPDIGGQGLNGIGGGLDDPGGPNGITRSPFDKAVPPPGMTATSDALGAPYPNTINTDGGMPAGSQLPDDITPRKPGNTIDKR